MKNYTELDVWKLSRALVSDIYKLTSSFPKDEIYVLTSQMRRSVISIPSNIAEGHGRSTSKDTIHFLHIARGSLYELETQVFLSVDLNYCNLEEATPLFISITNCRKMLNGLIRYFENLK
jgi:four helix bundle protein